MTRALVTTMAALAIGACTAGDAYAQSTPSSGFDRWTVAGGLSWTGTYPIGDATASLRQNATGTPPPSLTLFQANSEFESAPGVEGRFGFALTPRLAIEVGGAYAKPKVRVAITGDTEAENTTFEGETVAQYVIDVSAVFELPIVRRTARVRPYVIGGGSYLRQLHEERTLVETGQLYHLGGGARLFFHGASSGHPFGIRGDIQATYRRDGIEFESKTRVMPTASVLVFFGF